MAVEYQHLLIPPVIEELSRNEQELIKEEQVVMSRDPWWQEHKTANFSSEIHPKFLGFYINRHAHPLEAIRPAFKTDNGIFAVKKSGNSMSDWTVDENEVYRADIIF